MSLFETIKSIFVTTTQKLTYRELDSGRVKRTKPAADQHGPAQKDPLKAGNGYFRMWLAEMYLEHDRVLFQKRNPTVHTLVSFQFGEAAAKPVEIPSVAGPLQLKIQNNDLRNVINLRHRLTSLMPFNGGTVEIAACLIAVPGDNAAKAFLGVMEDLSGLLAVPQLSAALKIAEPLANGVQALANLAADSLAVGLHQTFGGNKPLAPGYIAIFNKPENAADADPAKLWVVDDQLRVGASADNSKPYTNASYLLFEIETQPERDDWDQLTAITQPFDEAMKLLQTKETREQAKASARAAQVAALTSRDLATVDRLRVAKAIDERFKTYLNLFEAQGAVAQAAPTLADTVKGVTRAAVVGLTEADLFSA